MPELQQVEPTEPRTASPRKRKLSDFNYRDPNFDDHDPEFLAFIENAPREEKRKALAASLDVAWAQVEAGDYISATPEQLSEGMRRGLSFDEMKQWLEQSAVHA